MMRSCRLELPAPIMSVNAWCTQSVHMLDFAPADRGSRQYCWGYASGHSISVSLEIECADALKELA
jgi:hypothetical protein